MKRNSQGALKNNPNPEANIGFICYLPSHYYLLRNIYNHLSNAEFIIGDKYRYDEPNKYIDFTKAFLLKETEIHWRFIDPESPDPVRAEFYNKYAVLVSPLYHGDIAATYNRDKKLVRMMQSYDDGERNWGIWNTYFDLFLVFGKYAYDQLKVYDNSEVIGNPKGDDPFFSKNFAEDIKELKKEINLGRKTILYLPASGYSSSIEAMVSVIRDLSTELNIFIKLPPQATVDPFEQKRVALYRQMSNVLIFDDTNSIAPLVQLSDYILTDLNHGAFDALLYNKPLVILNYISKAYQWQSGTPVYGQGNQRKISQSDPLKDLIKNPDKAIGPLVTLLQTSKSVQFSKSEISQALKDSIDQKSFNKNRLKLKKMLFSYTDGSSGKKAAGALISLLNKGKKSPNLLADALDEYQNYLIDLEKQKKTQIWKEKSNDELLQSIVYYSKIRSLPFVKRVATVIKEFFIS